MKRQNTGFNDGNWSVPAGRLNSGETIREAATREAKEEVNASINITDLSIPLVMHHKDARGERLYFFFRCDKWNDELINMEPASCSGIRWFDLDALPVNVISHVKTALESIQRGVCYMEYGF